MLGEKILCKAYDENSWAHIGMWLLCVNVMHALMDLFATFCLVHLLYAIYTKLTNARVVSRNTMQGMVVAAHASTARHQKARRSHALAGSASTNAMVGIVKQWPGCFTENYFPWCTHCFWTLKLVMCMLNESLMVNAGSYRGPYLSDCPDINLP